MNATPHPPTAGGTAMREWRRALGWTQGIAATQLGLSRRQLQNYESGSAEIPRAIGLAMRYLAEHPVAD